METRPEDLYEIYLRLAEERRQEPPVDLDAIWTTLRESNYLRQRGSIVQDGPDGATLTVRGIAGLMLDSILTNSRGFFEKGVPGQEGRLGFTSYGDPTFDAILTQVDGLPLPCCARRLSVGLEGYPAEVVGYAVAVREEGGMRRVELVASWRQLQSLELDEAAELTDVEVEPLRAQLLERIRQEVQPRAVRRIEQANVRAGRAQQILAHLVMASLIDSHRTNVPDGDQFWPVFEDLRDIINERDRLIVPDVPAEQLRAVRPDLLFDCTIPTASDRARLTAPKILLQAAADAVSRLADSLRERKSEVTTDRMLQRLRREVERGLKSLRGGGI
jgi:hypothetical protein